MKYPLHTHCSQKISDGNTGGMGFHLKQWVNQVPGKIEKKIKILFLICLLHSIDQILIDFSWIGCFG